MAQAPVDIPIKVRGLSDLQKLERRMEALEKEVTRLGKGLPKAANNVRNFGRASRGASGGIKALGAAVKSALGPLVAATAAVGSLTAAFRIVASQDFALAKVRSLGVDSVALAENLKRVSEELEGNASVAELTGAAYDVASAGFTNAADAARILKAASLGATGGFTDINTVADAATSVLNAYGKSAKEAGLIVDQFIQTQNDGKIVVAQYAANISKVAPVAAALGIELAEVNAVISQVTAGGTNAEVAFTGLKTALAQLASGNANKALAEIGIEITQADIASEGLIGVLKKIKESGIDVGTAFKAFGNEAAPVLQAVFNDLEKTEKLLENQENAAGAAAKAQQEAAKTINGAWGRVRVAFENLFADQSALAQAIIPILDGVARGIDDIAESVEGYKLLIEDAAKIFEKLKLSLPSGEKFTAIADGIKSVGQEVIYALNPLQRFLDLLGDAAKERAGVEARAKEIYNVGGIQYDENMVPINPPQTVSQQREANDTAEWLPKKPKIDLGGDSGLAAKIAKDTGEAEKQLTKQLKEKAAAIELVTKAYDGQKSALAKIEADNTYLQNTITFGEEAANKIREINRLVLEGVPFSEAYDIVTLNEGLQETVDKMGEVNDKLTEGQELAKGAYDIISGSLTDSISGLIDGTKEWGDVLSDIAGQLGKMFLNAGFSALGAGLKIPGFADGGRPPTNQVSVVGERGPELFIPDSAGTVLSNSQSRNAMDRYSANGGGGGGTFKLETVIINNVEYATVAQVDAMGRAAAKEGAANGNSMTMTKLRNSRASRSRIGLGQ